jgi:hypothetical protein
MLTDLQKLQRRGARLDGDIERMTRRRSKALAALLKEASTVEACDHLLKRLHRRRDRVIEAVREYLRAEKRKAKPPSAPPELPPAQPELR